MPETERYNLTPNLGGGANAVPYMRLVVESGTTALDLRNSSATQPQLAPSYSLAPARTSNVGSPAYFAALRRRHAHLVAKAVEALSVHADREDFVLFAHPIVEQLRALITKTLIEADEEGNSREVFRRVRDSLMDGGWKKYKEEHVRLAVAGVLHAVGQAEHVTGEDVAKAVVALQETGLETLTMVGVDVEDDEVLD
jgi:hypothetical protein